MCYVRSGWCGNGVLNWEPVSMGERGGNIARLWAKWTIIWTNTILGMDILLPIRELEALCRRIAQYLLCSFSKAVTTSPKIVPRIWWNYHGYETWWGDLKSFSPRKQAASTHLCKLWNVESVTRKRGTLYFLYGRDNVSARLSCWNSSILVQPTSVISIYTLRSMKGMCR